MTWINALLSHAPKYMQNNTVWDWEEKKKEKPQQHRHIEQRCKTNIEGEVSCSSVGSRPAATHEAPPRGPCSPHCGVKRRRRWMGDAGVSTYVRVCPVKLHNVAKFHVDKGETLISPQQGRIKGEGGWGEESNKNKYLLLLYTGFGRVLKVGRQCFIWIWFWIWISGDLDACCGYSHCGLGVQTHFL